MKSTSHLTFVVKKYSLLKNDTIETHVFTTNPSVAKSHASTVSALKIRISTKIPLKVHLVSLRADCTILEMQGVIQECIKIAIPMQHLFWYENDTYTTTYKIIKQKNVASLFVDYMIDIKEALDHKPKKGGGASGDNEWLDFDIEDQNDDEDENGEEELMRQYVESVESSGMNADVRIKLDKNMINQRFKIVPLSICQIGANREYFLADMNELQRVLMSWSIKTDVLYQAFILKFWPMIDFSLLSTWLDGMKITYYSIENSPYITAKNDTVYEKFISYNNNHLAQVVEKNVEIKSISIEIKHLNDMTFKPPSIVDLSLVFQNEITRGGNDIVMAFYANTSIDNNKQLNILSTNTIVLHKMISLFPSHDIDEQSIVLFFVSSRGYYVELTITDAARVQMAINFNGCETSTDVELIERTVRDIIVNLEKNLTPAVREELGAIATGWRRGVYNIQIMHIGFMMRINNTKISRQEFDQFTKFIVSEINKTKIAYVETGTLNVQRHIILLLFKIGVVSSRRIEQFMYKESIVNGFQLMSNSGYKTFWEGVQTTHMKVILKGVDAVIRVSYVYYENLHTVINFLHFILENYMKTRSAVVVKRPAIHVSKLSVLIATDPVLYQFKSTLDKRRGFGPYSMRCQKEHQPEIFSEKEFKCLKEEKTRDLTNSVKYFNHTTGDALFYLCPKKYPYFSPIIGKHPESRCMGCCQKTPPNTGWKERIFNQCMETGIVTIEDMKRIKSEYKMPNIRHIINYNKTFDPGRIYKMPEDIGHKLNKYINNAIFRILSVGSIVHGMNVGLFYALAAALDITNYKEYFNKLLAKMHKMPQRVRNMYFAFATLSHSPNMPEYVIRRLADVIINQSADSVQVLSSVLINLDNVVVTIFNFTHNLNVILLQPPALTFYDVSSYSNLRVNRPGSKYVVVVQKQKDHGQIGIMFFSGIDVRKSELFIRKLFYSDDQLIKVFSRIVNTVKVPQFESMTAMKLHNLGYKIAHIHVDGAGFCFGANIGFYVPFIPYMAEGAFKHVTDLPDLSDVPTIANIKKLIKHYNSEMEDESDITPTAWVATSSRVESRFGVIINRRIWYFDIYKNTPEWEDLLTTISDVTLENARAILRDSHSIEVPSDPLLWHEFTIESRFIELLADIIKREYRNQSLRAKINKILAHDRTNITQKIINLLDNKIDTSMIVEIAASDMLNSRALSKIVFRFDMDYAHKIFSEMKAHTIRCGEIKRLMRSHVKITETPTVGKGTIMKLTRAEYDNLVDYCAGIIVNDSYRMTFFGITQELITTPNLIMRHVYGNTAQLLMRIESRL